MKSSRWKVPQLGNALKAGGAVILIWLMPAMATAACAPNNLQLIPPTRVSDGTTATTQLTALGNGFPDSPVPKLIDLNGEVTDGTLISSTSFSVTFAVPTTVLWAPGIYHVIMGNSDINCPSPVPQPLASNFSKANYGALGETSVPSTAHSKDQILRCERDPAKCLSLETSSSFGGASQQIYDMAGLGAHALEEWMRNRGPSEIAPDLVNCSWESLSPLPYIEQPAGALDSLAFSPAIPAGQDAWAFADCPNKLGQIAIEAHAYSNKYCTGAQPWEWQLGMHQMASTLWPSTEASVNLVPGNLFMKQTFLHLPSRGLPGLDLTIYGPTSRGAAIWMTQSNRAVVVGTDPR